jgi:hypothetical protein
LVPPWPVMNSGKRKKVLMLDIVNKFAKAIVRNVGLYSIGYTLVS